MLVADHLRQAWDRIELQGEILGEVVMVPLANPIGLAQRLFGDLQGRFSFADGVNFNRQYRDVTDAIADRVNGRLSPTDAALNVALIRDEFRRVLGDWKPANESESLRKILMQLANDADFALDLHCDGEACMHIYSGERVRPALWPLARLLGARAYLTADDSGDHPFDEGLARPWWELAKRFPDAAIPPACAAATIELRGQLDVNDMLAAADAAAVVAFARSAGVVGGSAGELPPPACSATPLAAVQPLKAPTAGLLVFQCDVGDVVERGERIAEVLDPLSGQRTAICAEVSGVLFARTMARFVTAGQRIAKVAGQQIIRSGPLLSP